MLTVDWSKAPKWAKYAAMNRGGLWYWFEERPTPFRGDYLPMGRCERMDEIEWYASTIKRPKVKVRVRQASVNQMQCSASANSTTRD